MGDAAQGRLREIEDELRETLRGLRPAGATKAFQAGTVIFLGSVTIQQLVIGTPPGELGDKLPR